MSDGVLRKMTVDEQQIVASVVRMVDRLKAGRFVPKSVILNDVTWGTEGDHFSVILGLPVVHRRGTDYPAIQVGVDAP